MNKRIVSIILVLCLALLICPPATGAMSLSNFERIRTYNGEFADVSPSAWYFEGVKSVFERGLMEGRGTRSFQPSGTITLAETVKIAAYLHSGYHTGTMIFPSGTPWYRPYVEYATRNGIPVDNFRNLNAAATRSDFALIISGALPDEAITPKNRIADGAIPDVFEGFSYGPAVYRLYRAGVLTGSDYRGTFFPGRTLTRAEAATIIARVVDANERVSLSLAPTLSGEEIYKMASPAVFFIEAFDENGTRMRTGSGFFICETGKAVTNYHVIVASSSAKITLHDGEVLDVAGVYDYHFRRDAALIQIEGEGFPYLEVADSSMLLTGSTVYALGSPLGLHASFSRGIVSQSLREVDRMQFIQLDAAISSGSSGGALLDTAGRAVGVTAATMIGGQNLNLAVPINFFLELSSEKYVPLTDIFIDVVYFEHFYPAPDFGAYFNVRPFNAEDRPRRAVFNYRVSDLEGYVEDILDEYEHLLEQNKFEFVGFHTSGDNVSRAYLNSARGIRITIGIREVRGTEAIVLNITSG